MKANYLAYGFRQVPEVIMSSRRFSAAEKAVISKVFDMMFLNKEDQTYSGTAWPSDAYLSNFCGVSTQTVQNTKKKVKEIGIFDIQRRPYNSSIWILKDIPDVLVEDHQELIREWEEKREDRRMSNRELAKILEPMTPEERKQYMEAHPNI